LEKTLLTLMRCDPAPAEILVHLDEAEPDTAEYFRQQHPTVKCLVSASAQGPGGARNRLIAAAAFPWVVNFDDDARPLNADFFLQVETAVRTFPDAAMLTFSNQPQDWTPLEPRTVAVPSGYASVFNKAWFERLGGFVPLPFAYCMEEVDIGLRIHAAKGRMIHIPEVRIQHDMIIRPVEKAFQAQVLGNIALFFFLRYPLVLWPLAALKLLRRLLWLALRCPKALPAGLAHIPSHLWRYRHHRRPVNAGRIVSWLLLQRRPIPVTTKDTH